VRLYNPRIALFLVLSSSTFNKEFGLNHQVSSIDADEYALIRTILAGLVVNCNALIFSIQLQSTPSPWERF
jgi:hypothetical protein